MITDDDDGDDDDNDDICQMPGKWDEGSLVSAAKIKFKTWNQILIAIICFPNNYLFAIICFNILNTNISIIIICGKQVGRQDQI